MNALELTDLPMVSKGVGLAMSLLGQVTLTAYLEEEGQEVQIDLNAGHGIVQIADKISIRASSNLGEFIVVLPTAAVDLFSDFLLPNWRVQLNDHIFREMRTAFVIAELLQAFGLPRYDWTLQETIETPQGQPLVFSLNHAEMAFQLRMWLVDCNEQEISLFQPKEKPLADVSELSVRLQMQLPAVAASVKELAALELGDLFVIGGQHAEIPVRVGVGNSMKFAGSIDFEGVCTILQEKE